MRIAYGLGIGVQKPGAPQRISLGKEAYWSFKMWMTKRELSIPTFQIVQICIIIQYTELQ